MLDRFQVPAEIAIRVPQENMRATVEAIFQKLSLPHSHAIQAADVLMYADLRGVESHGVSNMMRVYVRDIQEGKINPAPKWKIVRDSAAVCTIDSDRGLGLVVGPAAMNIAIERAHKYGIGSVAVTNGRHCGAAGYHAAIALAHDMIGVAMTTGGVSMVPTHGSKPMVGLNAIAVAAPTHKEPPFLFDASMSSVAGNKIRLAQRLGVNVMPGWISEPDGTPITDDRPIPSGYMMLPLGGTREIGSHKGYSLAVMVEILSSILSAGGAGPNRRGGISHHFLAYKIDAFTDVPSFKKDMDTYMTALSQCPPITGQERVAYAGLPEYEEEFERRVKGIPYHPEVIRWFQNTTDELGLPDLLKSL